MPAFYPTIRKTKEDWQFKTEENDNVCQGMVGKVCHIAKGKVLGGSSTINNMHYMRANPYDFEKWYAWGNGEWNPDSVDEAYAKVENFIGPPQCPSLPVQYGKTGEITIDKFKNPHFVKDAILQSVKEIDYLNLDEYHLGYQEIVGTLDKGTRYNMARAFLTKIKHRRNLFVLKNCVVTKLIIPDIREKQIKGVEGLIHNTKLIKLKANNEVILSAGAINTAKIMLQSGLGPQTYLSEMEVPLVADLQVGENFHEHFGVPIFVRLDLNESAVQLDELVDATYFYVMYKNGPLSKTNINDLVGFINTGEDPTELPNMVIYHYLFKPNDLSLKGHMERIGYDSDIIKSLMKHNVDQMLVVFTPTLLKPKSRGTIYLNRTDPLSPPIIKANFLSNDEDLIAFIHGYKYVGEMVKTSPFLKLNAQLLQIDLPNCRNFKFSTDSFIKCHIRNVGYPQGHVVGTAKMGPNIDSDAVVDENLLVKKVTGLRIVDASFMPEIVSADIQATMAMVGEKISKVIIKEWMDSLE